MQKTQRKECWRFIMNNRCPSKKDNTLYVNWRKEITKRDGGKCVLCDSTNRLQTHHIETWAHKPELRFDTNNGVLLCYPCHALTFKKEEEYEYIFKNYLLKLNNKKMLSSYELYRKHKYEDSNGQENSDTEV